jgi:decaprenyl-phosphate phosphoribosyltransferase
MSAPALAGGRLDTGMNLASQVESSKPGGLAAHIALARPDHWYKNAFMALGAFLAAFYRPDLPGLDIVPTLLLAILATCLLASSNYVLNELLDAETDAHHPTKSSRPLVTGAALQKLAWAEWFALVLAGLATAAFINPPFLYSAAFFLVMAVLYNVPPIRLKDLTYVDFLAEALNNPIRLLLGWFAVESTQFPPVSLLLAYWAIGAFFMAAKRLAELRHIGDQARARSYRHSFHAYNEENLLISMLGVIVVFSVFLGVFIIRYHLELILIVPLITAFVCQYLRVVLRHESAAQSTELLVHEKSLVAYAGLCGLAFVVLMLIQIPALYDLFNVQASTVSPLWRLEPR